MSKVVSAAQNAASENGDHIFQMLITLTKSDSAARMLAGHIANYGIACFMDGLKYERKRKQKGVTDGN